MWHPGAAFLIHERRQEGLEHTHVFWKRERRTGLWKSLGRTLHLPVSFSKWGQELQVSCSCHWPQRLVHGEGLETPDECEQPRVIIGERAAANQAPDNVEARTGEKRVKVWNHCRGRHLQDRVGVSKTAENV